MLSTLTKYPICFLKNGFLPSYLYPSVLVVGLYQTLHEMKGTIMDKPEKESDVILYHVQINCHL